MRDDPRKLTTAQLRLTKPDRLAFARIPRKPVTVVLDRVRRPYNIGALFRLCDAMLVKQLVICGVETTLTNRKFIQAARGTQTWVPWARAPDAVQVLKELKQQGSTIIVAEQTTGAVSPEELNVQFPICLVLGSEADGVSSEVLKLADAAVAIPVHGMSNSLNVSTAAAILLHRLCRDNDTAARA